MIEKIIFFILYFFFLIKNILRSRVIIDITIETETKNNELYTLHIQSECEKFNIETYFDTDYLENYFPLDCYNKK